MLASPREKPILRGKNRIIALLLPILVTAIALHLYSPTGWTLLQLKLLHSLHGPGFAGLTLAVLWVLRLQKQTTLNYPITAAILASVIVIAELSQTLIDRNAELNDFVTDIVAVAGMLGLVSAIDVDIWPYPTKRLRVLVALGATIALLWACVPFARLGYAHIQQQRTFPSLLTNEYAWEREQIRAADGQLPGRLATPTGWPDGGNAILESSPEGPYGIFLNLHPAKDWTGYDRLSFVMSSMGREQNIMICIREMRASSVRAGRRTCHELTAATVPARYSIQLKTKGSTVEDSIDLSQIAAVIFSEAKPGQRVRLRLDDIRLETSAISVP